jgi:hypothetical protein
MTWNTYQEFIAWLETDPPKELREQAFKTIPQDWVWRFMKEYM